MIPSLIPNPSAGLTLCAWCKTWRQPAELVEVERLTTAVHRFVCRYRDCFRHGIGSVAIDRIIGPVGPAAPRPDPPTLGPVLGIAPPDVDPVVCGGCGAVALSSRDAANRGGWRRTADSELSCGECSRTDGP